MAERIFIRKLNDYQWQWRVLGSDHYWTDIAGAGDFEQMKQELENISMPACLIVPGFQTVIEYVEVDVKEKNHIAKLVPYEMEETIVEPIDDLQFAFGNVADGKVLTSYIRDEALQHALDQCAELKVDVQHIFPDFLFIAAQADTVTILIDNGFLIVRFPDGTGLAIEEDLAEVILHKAALEMNAPQYITIVAQDEEHLNRLRTSLPGAWTGEEDTRQNNAANVLDELDEETFESGDARIKEEIGDFWQWIDVSILNSSLNFRRGKFARRLPIERWWQLWQFPTYVAAAAFVLSLSIAGFEYIAAKSEGKEIRQQIEQVYLQAVPNGRRGDEERRLESLLKGTGGENKSSEPSNLMVLLAGLSKAMEKQSDVKLSNFRYNGEQRELQVNLLVKGLDELGQFREQLTQIGLESGSPRTSLQGQEYQASMKVTEKTL